MCFNLENSLIGADKLLFLLLSYCLQNGL